MSTIPTFTAQTIRTFVGEQHFQKGQRLVHGGAILHPEQQAMARPWFAEHQNIREISMKLGNWEAVRQEALTFLEATKNSSTLVEVALDEGDIERALQLLRATKPSGPDGYAWQYDYAQTPEVALKAAERAEEIDPRASIDLYQQHVERLIAGRGRANYQAACSYLVKIRSLYQKVDETEQWTAYIAWVRKRHSRLSTLKAELIAANLEGEKK